MTQNQIRYLQAMEEVRANKAKEQENYRSNLARETETNRANLENERMAREKWDYEKYGSGSGSAGSVIRTIKAGVNDVSKLVDATKDAIKEANTTKTPNQMLGVSSGSVDYGGLDVHKVAKEAASTLNPYRNYSLDQLRAELKALKSGDFTPGKDSSNSKMNVPVATRIGQIQEMIKEKEEKSAKTQSQGRKKQAKYFGDEFKGMPSRVRTL